MLTQLALIIAFCASLSSITRAEEMFGNCTDIQTRHSNHDGTPILLELSWFSTGLDSIKYRDYMHAEPSNTGYMVSVNAA